MPDQQPGTPRDAVIGQSIREGIAAAISLAILTITIWMLVSIFNAGGQPFADKDKELNAAKREAFNRQKDIMLYALALLGTVTGYYFGRVPAELHAQRAQQHANAAQIQLATTQDKLTSAATTAAQAIKEKEQVKNDAKATLERITPLVAAVVQEQRTALGAAAPTLQAAGLAQAQVEIEQLLQRLG